MPRPTTMRFWLLSSSPAIGGLATRLGVSRSPMVLTRLMRATFERIFLATVTLLNWGSILGDVRSILLYRKHAEERGLTPVGTGVGQYWAFPP